MAKKNIIKKEVSTGGIGGDPLLDTQVASREYSKVKIDSSISDIEEPDIKGKTYRGGNIEDVQEEKGFEPGSTANPSLVDMDSRTKTKSAEYMADTAIAAYESLHEGGKEYIKYNESKLEMKAIKGEFDIRILEVEIPYDEKDLSQTISVKDFLTKMNDETDEALKVDPDFKEKARPLLIEVFKKKGWGLTPEQQLLILIGEDLIPKVVQLIAIKNNMQYILDLGMRIYAKGGGGIINNPPENNFDTGGNGINNDTENIENTTILEDDEQEQEQEQEQDQEQEGTVKVSAPQKGKRSSPKRGNAKRRKSIKKSNASKIADEQVNKMMGFDEINEPEEK